MNKKDNIWIKSMELFCRYWGCHQMPERSFYFRGYQLPVCARCTGIIIGELSACVTAFFIDIPSYILFALLVPMVVDGLLQLKTQYVSTNSKRALTGVLFGYSLILLIVNIIKYLWGTHL